MRPRSSFLKIGLALLLAAAVFSAACSFSKSPDMGAIYGRSAKHADPYRNPVIVIPGLLGSRLVDASTQTTVWGAFGGSGIDIRRPEDQRLFALPMDGTTNLAELRDGVQPNGVLDRIKVRLAGLPLQLKAYHRILEILGAGGFRDETIVDVDYGEGHFTCFQFDYDWRRDNVENARRLAAFIDEKQAYVQQELRRLHPERQDEVKFDLIAHSMGGVLARYFLRFGDADLPSDGSIPKVTWKGTDKVENVVFIATPNAGAVDALKQMVEGRKFALAPRYPSSVLGTFPSGYQLLPRTRHRHVIDANGQTVDSMQVETWRHYAWGLFDPKQEDVLAALLPEVQHPTERARIATDYVRQSLERAEQLHAALDQPAQPPEGVRLHLIAGDSVPTANVALARRGKLTIVETAPGDGSVLRSSALMDERVGQEWQPGLRSPIHWTDVDFFFDDHLGLTRNPELADNLLYLLLESQ